MADDALKAMNYPQAVIDVIEERRRQVCSEGWTARHDDEHHNGDMALAAACYACNAATWNQRDPSLMEKDYGRLSSPGFRWPWAQKWWKPKSQRRDLVRAAALLIAEIERLDRKALPFNSSGDDGDCRACGGAGCPHCDARACGVAPNDGKTK